MAWGLNILNTLIVCLKEKWAARQENLSSIQSIKFLTPTYSNLMSQRFPVRFL